MNRLRFIEGYIDRYADMAWRTAYVSLRNAADADELLQQAFLVAWRKADSAPQERAWPWLAGIIINEARTFQVGPSQTAGTLPEDVDQAILEQAELAALVHIALLHLTFEQRIAIILTHLAGLGDQDAADALGIPLFMLRERVRDGLGDMLSFLGDRVTDLPATLRKLPIAAPSAGLAAAKAVWISTLGASAVVPAASAVGAIVAAGVWGVAAAALLAVIILAQPSDVPRDEAEIAVADVRQVPAAGRVLPRVEPSTPVRARPTVPPPSEPSQVLPETPRLALPVAPPEMPKPPEGVEPEGSASSDWRLPEIEAPELLRNAPDYVYMAVAGISGTISSVGSDTLANLMTLWAEGFRKHYPNVQFSVESKGSTTGPPALMDGTAHLAPMSREMKQEEIDKFEKKYGYKPSYVVVAIDAVAVYVHKDNPIESLSMQQVDAIFSSTRKGGGSDDISKWGQVGLAGEWDQAEITLYGRNSVSSTYGYFKQTALCKGDFKKTVKEQAGSAAVVQSISVDRNAIGYAGVSYKTAGVKAVPLSKKEGERAYKPANQNCHSGDYPLSRNLYIYLNREPGKGLNPAVQEFLRYIHSKEGQAIVEKDGFIPLTQEIVDKHRGRYEKIE